MKAFLILALATAMSGANPELSFRFVTPCTPQSRSFTFVYHGDAEQMCLEDAPALEGSDFAGVTAVSDKIVRLALSKDGTRKFSHITSSNIGRRIAVAFGDKVLEAPWIRQQTILFALNMRPEVDKATLDTLVAAYPPPKTP